MLWFGSICNIYSSSDMLLSPSLSLSITLSLSRYLSLSLFSFPLSLCLSLSPCPLSPLPPLSLPLSHVAICSPSCENGGVCSSPNNCICPEGWSGAICTEGTINYIYTLLCVKVCSEFIIQMFLSAYLRRTCVTIMLLVLIFLGATHVLVTMASKEMDFPVQVSPVIQLYCHEGI